MELGYPYKIETKKTIKYYKREPFEWSSSTQGDFAIWKESKKAFKPGRSKVFSFEEIKALNQKIIELESKSE